MPNQPSPTPSPTPSIDPDIDMHTPPTPKPPDTPPAEPPIPPPIFELARYILYALSLTLSLLPWTLTITHLRPPKSALTPHVGPLRCIVFNDYSEWNPPVTTPISSSALCDVLIAFGVVMTAALLAVIVAHSLAYFGRPRLPYMLETVVCAVLALLEAVFALAVLVKAPASVVRNSVEVRAVVGGGFATGGGLFAVAVLAFVQDHLEQVERERAEEGGGEEGKEGGKEEGRDVQVEGGKEGDEVRPVVAM